MAGKKLIEVIDELMAIGNEYGFDTEVSMFVFEDKSGLYVTDMVSDTMGGMMPMTVGAIHVPMANRRCG